MSDSRVGGYPMGVTDAAIERHFGGDCKPRMCGNCRHFCGRLLPPRVRARLRRRGA